MNIYELESKVDFQGELVSIKDGSKRIFRYFVLDEGDNKFLSFTPTKGIVDSPYTISTISKTDYLEALIPIPIFSARAKKILEREIPSEVEFYPLLIDVDGEEIEFYLAKTKVICRLVDETRSTYMSLPGAGQILDEEVFFSDFDSDFHIARDAKYPDTVCVSQRFLEICRSANLQIEFKAVAQ